MGENLGLVILQPFGLHNVLIPISNDKIPLYSSKNMKLSKNVLWWEIGALTNLICIALSTTATFPALALKFA